MSSEEFVSVCVFRDRESRIDAYKLKDNGPKPLVMRKMLLIVWVAIGLHTANISVTLLIPQKVSIPPTTPNL